MKIGYQSGIKAAMTRLRKLDPGGKAAYDKLERTLQILADAHDATIDDPPPPGPPPPPPPPSKVIAPRTYNKVLPGGSDARFCVAGLTKGDDGLWHDSVSGYDDNGLDVKGGRSKDTQVVGLRQANNMNGMDPCTLYDGMVTWPAASYEI